MGVWIETKVSDLATKNIEVTPFVGVWIETEKVKFLVEPVRSHPSWVCGLKHLLDDNLVYPLLVTPFVGVWIETVMLPLIARLHMVTPFVGVWIET